MEQPNLLFYKKISIYTEYVRIEHWTWGLIRFRKNENSIRNNSLESNKTADKWEHGLDWFSTRLQLLMGLTGLRRGQNPIPSICLNPTRTTCSLRVAFWRVPSRININHPINQIFTPYFYLSHSFKGHSYFLANHQFSQIIICENWTPNIGNNEVLKMRIHLWDINSLLIRKRMVWTDSQDYGADEILSQPFILTPPVQRAACALHFEGSPVVQNRQNISC